MLGGFLDIGAYEGAYVFAPVPNASGVLFVKKGSAGTGNSWQNAIGEVADALKYAKNNTAIKEIWVSAGTYYPMYSPRDGANFADENRNNAF
ncbi:MAG: hypothetical protein LBE82_06905, partial [Chitinophagaceae bacterium]|nr:hypothetical protein [Chitinophagaceae bacterium]